MPADPGDSNPLERGTNLPFQDCREIDSLATTIEPRGEHEVRRLRAVTLCSPFQQRQLQSWMHRERLRGGFRFRAYQNAAASPVVLAGQSERWLPNASGLV
jgi:hypothetical protein